MILHKPRTFEVQSETFWSWDNQNQSMSTNVLLHKHVRMWLQKIQLFSPTIAFHNRWSVSRSLGCCIANSWRKQIRSCRWNTVSNNHLTFGKESLLRTKTHTRLVSFVLRRYRGKKAPFDNQLNFTTTVVWPTCERVRYSSIAHSFMELFVPCFFDICNLCK